ncbi:hypothetical protein KW805_00065 [Candidatus Pacearchaeota archaeon]|nr:hypothetical protein [Candidatus Pacearchaeota archaeon]
MKDRETIYFDAESVREASDALSYDLSQLSNEGLLTYIDRLQDRQETIVLRGINSGATREDHTLLRMYDLAIQRAHDDFEGRGRRKAA